VIKNAQQEQYVEPSCKQFIFTIEKKITMGLEGGARAPCAPYGSAPVCEGF